MPSVQITLLPMLNFLCSLVNTTPLLKDLYKHITPQYAADWKVIGTLLDLSSGELKSIEAGNPTNVKWCCNQMLENWLEKDTAASWGKLFAVIESPAVASTSDEGNCYTTLTLHHKRISKQTKHSLTHLA